MLCRNCKFFGRKAAKDVIGRIMLKRRVRCLWVSTEQYPKSISGLSQSRPIAGYTSANCDARCPCFQKRED
jgi:hypothetical protein